MKIVVITSKFFPEYTGPGVRILNLYQWLWKRKLITLPVVVCGAKDQKKSAIFSYQGHEVHRLCTWFNRLELPKMINILIDNLISPFRAYFYLNKYFMNINVVHIFGSSGLTKGAYLWALRHNKAIVLEFVNSNYENIRVQQLFGLYSPRASNRTIFVAISESLSERLKNTWSGCAVWHRPNPVDVERFKFESSRMALRALREKSSPPPMNLLMVASWISRKNHSVAIRAMQFLPDNYRLKIVGPITNAAESGPNFEKCRSLISELNLENRVTIGNQFVDTAEELKHADVFLLPAVNEGLGTPMLEALSAGVPVVANEKEPAFREWLIDGYTGSLSSIEPKDFASGVIRAVSIDQERFISYVRKLQKWVGADDIHDSYWRIFRELGSDHGNAERIVKEIQKTFGIKV